MDKADIFFGRTLKLTLGWKIRSHRSENGKKIMGEDPQSLENHGFPQISQLVLHSIKSLEIKRFQGFFLFSNRKVLDQASGILCTKFSRFEGQNLVQSRWVVYGMNRSSPLLCPAAILVLPDATFAGGSLFRSALLSKPATVPNPHQKPSLGPLPCPALKATAQRQTAGIQPVLPLCIACWFLIHFISAFYFSGLKSCRKGFVMVY